MRNMPNLGRIDELRLERHGHLTTLRLQFDNELPVSKLKRKRVQYIDEELRRLWGPHMALFGREYSYGRGSYLR